MEEIRNLYESAYEFQEACTPEELNDAEREIMKDRVTPKWAPAETMTTQGMQPVLRVIAHPPGTCRHIREDLWAVELITPVQSRFFGFENAFIDSHLQMRCEGYNPLFTEVMGWPNAED